MIIHSWVAVTIEVIIEEKNHSIVIYLNIMRTRESEMGFMDRFNLFVISLTSFTCHLTATERERKR
jgi:hypothetical protein